MTDCRSVGSEGAAVLLVTEFTGVDAVRSSSDAFPADCVPSLGEHRAELLRRLHGVRALILRDRARAVADRLGRAP